MQRRALLQPIEHALAIATHESPRTTKLYDQTIDTITLDEIEKILMLVDVVYPGFMPYKNLGIAGDVQDLIEAHDVILKYDFDVFVAGHITRLGKRQDVEISKELLNDLKTVAAQNLYALPFPACLQSPAAQKLVSREKRSKWDLHNEYEKELIKRCETELKPHWTNRLLDTETYLKDNCWAMIEALTVSLRLND